MQYRDQRKDSTKPSHWGSQLTLHFLDVLTKLGRGSDCFTPPPRLRDAGFPLCPGNSSPYLLDGIDTCDQIRTNFNRNGSPWTTDAERNTVKRRWAIYKIHITYIYIYPRFAGEGRGRGRWRLFKMQQEKIRTNCDRNREHCKLAIYGTKST